MPPSVSQDLARRLLVCEALSDTSSPTSQPAAIRVFEKLRRTLSELAGVAGFHSLASRALTLAKSETSDLSAVHVMVDGSLEGMQQFGPQGNGDHAGDVILIAQLLGLLNVFVGAALTLSLLQDVWPDAALEDSDIGQGRKE